MLTEQQVDQYRMDGFIVIPDVISCEVVSELRAVTDEFIENSRAVSSNTELYDLEPDHSADAPRVRRIKMPHLQHQAYGKLVANEAILGILRDLIGPSIRIDASKLNFKASSGGSAVEWHQDWAFRPSTNDDLCAVGIMLDDCAMENGPLLIVPGSHQGPVYDHHNGGRFCGAIDPLTSGINFDSAVPCLGPAGSISVHHTRAVHGSAVNRSDRTRRLLLLEYNAADAWPLVPQLRNISNFSAYMRDSLICGENDPVVPRVTDVPARLPLPGPEHSGSIFEIQRGFTKSYFG